MSAGRHRWTAVLSVVLAASLGIPAEAVADRTQRPPAADADRDGAYVVRETWLTDRLVDLTIYSPALRGTAPVRLMVPRGWTRHPGRTWPVLYLLHGCCENADYTAWSDLTDMQRFLADEDVLTVMPSGGAAGFYTGWRDSGRSAGPDWETFHVDELRRLLERDYGAGQRRAVAGLSLGGYGAMAYAFRHPGMFAAAASYSGMLNTLQPGVPAVVQGILLRENENPLQMWGLPVLQWSYWQARNPYDHVDALRGTNLYVSAGNGLPGRLDPPGTSPDPLEPATLSTSVAFTNRLKQRGIPVTTDYYGNGTHDWPYWQEQLHRSWPMFAASLGLG